MRQNQAKRLNKILDIYILFGVVLGILSLFVMFTPLAPMLMYKIYPSAFGNEYSSLTGNISQDVVAYEEHLQQTDTSVHIDESQNKDQSSQKEDDKDPDTGKRNPPSPEDTLPPFDPSLTKTNTLIIESIGVNSPIYEGADPKEALQQGPWIVNDFHIPPDQTPPVIIASHRWGGIGWNVNERTLKSFYNLPKTKVGDKIVIIWDQRKYEYVIDQVGEGDKIEKYDADLILYTCKLYWESPIRIFRYAHRVNWDNS